jgi:hypothetical protein
MLLQNDWLRTGRHSSIPNCGRNYSLRHHIQTVCRVYPAFYPVDTHVLFTEVRRPERKAATHFLLLKMGKDIPVSDRRGP